MASWCWVQFQILGGSHPAVLGISLSLHPPPPPTHTHTSPPVPHPLLPVEIVGDKHRVLWWVGSTRDYWGDYRYDGGLCGGCVEVVHRLSWGIV